jgi:hypothetical protein
VLAGRDYKLCIGRIFKFTDKHLWGRVGRIFGIECISAHKNHVDIGLSDVLHHFNEGSAEHPSSLLALFRRYTDEGRIKMNIAAMQKSYSSFFVFAHLKTPSDNLY